MSISRSVRLDEKTDKILNIVKERTGVPIKRAISEAVINYYGPLSKKKK